MMNVVIWLLVILTIKDFLVYGALLPPVNYYMNGASKFVTVFIAAAVTFGTVTGITYAYQLEYHEMIGGAAAILEVAACLIICLGQYINEKIDNHFAECAIASFTTHMMALKNIAAMVIIVAWARTSGYPV